MSLLSIALALVACAAIGLGWKFFRESQNLRNRFSGITDIEREISYAAQKLEELKHERDLLINENNERRTKLSAEYEEALNTYKRLKQEVATLEESLEDLSFGLYKPHFTFSTPEEFKTALTDIRDRARLAVRDGRAAFCPISWTVHNNAREGAKMVKQNTKLDPSGQRHGTDRHSCVQIAPGHAPLETRPVAVNCDQSDV